MAFTGAAFFWVNMANAKKPADDEDEAGPPGDHKLSFAEHLDELRKHLIRATLVLVGLMVLFLAFTDPITDFVIRPFEQLRAKLLLEGHVIPKLERIDPAEGFFFNFRVATYAAVFFGGPYAIYELWRFIAVGLYPKERKILMRFVPYSVALFLIGATFCYGFLLPMTLEFLARIDIDKFDNSWRTETYLDIFTNLNLALGLTFQLPLFQIALARFGILSAKTQAQHRKGFILGATIVAAVLTPSGDPYTLTAVTLPMIILFEIGILIAKRMTPKEAVT